MRTQMTSKTATTISNTTSEALENLTSLGVTTERLQKENSFRNESEKKSTVILSEQVYCELSDEPVTQQDPLQRLESNMALLLDLQTRYSFVLREVKYLMKA